MVLFPFLTRGPSLAHKILSSSGQLIRLAKISKLCIILLSAWLSWRERKGIYTRGKKLIIADVDCSHEMKRCLLLRRKAMTNRDSILKSRDITLPTKVHLVKAMIFPVVMHGCESWTIEKTERQRIDAFELWCWRRLLRVPWIARRSDQSILKEISPE